MRWSRVLGMLCFAGCVLSGGCSESVTGKACRSNTECASGFACFPSGDCLEAAEFTIQTALLPPAFLNETYAGVAFQAFGGVPPYEWRYEGRTAGGLEWVMLVNETGELHGKPGQTPFQTGEFQLVVYVRDHSNYGQGQEVSRLVSLFVNESRCGPAPCPQGEICCSGSCVFIANALDHCGACGNSCNRMSHVSGIQCLDGVCEYGDCLPGYNDCDGLTSNGCEQVADLNHCSDCGDDCTDTIKYIATRNQACLPEGCVFECEDGFGDCDEVGSNGCEAGLRTPSHCGECYGACADSLEGNLCMDDVFGQPMCGCLSDADCPEGRDCCEDLCVAPGPENCAGCGLVCGPSTGGPLCLDLAENDSWACHCNTDNDCSSGQAGSVATCDGGAHVCVCGNGAPCEGSFEETCCSDGGTPGCVNLGDDPAHCGRCEVACALGMNCTNGVCACDQANACPVGSAADFCDQGTCVCQQYGGQVCPQGQMCCNADMAVGCCIGSCEGAINGRFKCSSDCEAPKVWCEQGCCDSCDPADLGTCS